MSVKALTPVSPAPPAPLWGLATGAAAGGGGLSRPKRSHKTDKRHKRVRDVGGTLDGRAGITDNFRTTRCVPRFIIFLNKTKSGGEGRAGGQPGPWVPPLDPAKARPRDTAQQVCWEKAPCSLDPEGGKAKSPATLPRLATARPGIQTRVRSHLLGHLPPGLNPKCIKQC